MMKLFSWRWWWQQKRKLRRKALCVDGGECTTIQQDYDTNDVKAVKNDFQNTNAMYVASEKHLMRGVYGTVEDN